MGDPLGRLRARPRGRGRFRANAGAVLGAATYGGGEPKPRLAAEAVFAANQPEEGTEGPDQAEVQA